MFHIPERAEESAPAPTYVGHRDRKFRGVFAGVIPITIGVIFFVLGTYVVLDRWYSGRLVACQSALFVYPGAEILSRVDTPVTQPFGTVRTDMEMNSADEPTTVQSWYSRAWGLYVRRQVENQDRTEPFSIPPRGWDVEPNPSGSGTLIHLTGYCP